MTCRVHLLLPSTTTTNIYLLTVLSKRLHSEILEVRILHIITTGYKDHQSIIIMTRGDLFN